MATVVAPKLSARWADGIQRLSWGLRIALAAAGVLIFVAILAPLLEPHPPNAVHVGPSLSPPSARFLFGTDEYGRDVFARVLGGAQISITIGLSAVLVALVCAAVVGSLASVATRWVSDTIMRTMDVLMAFPGIIVAACVIAVVRPGIVTTVAVIAFLFTPALSRVIRAAVLTEYQKSYVDAAMSSGARPTWILTRQVAINCVGPVLVLTATMVADAIVLESSLSFLGLGIQPPAPSWGNLLADGRTELFAGAWWVCVFPGLAIFASVLILNVLAEGYSDLLSKPRWARESEQTQAQAPPAFRAEIRHTEIGDAEPDHIGPAADLADPEPDLAAPGALLRVEDLAISFPEVYGAVRVVSGVSFDVGAGEIVAVVGESGCGKSLIGYSLMGLLPATAAVSGRAMLGDDELLQLSYGSRRRLLGEKISMIYQDALSALNPAMTVGRQLAQVSRGSARAGRTGAELFDMVGLPSAALRSYPHQLSGGQRQRVLIAMALARTPALLIADEPTTALDETIQAQIVELLIELRRETGLAMLLITHDIALVKGIADRVLVMYAGQLVEVGETRGLATQPLHPYTGGLLAAISSLERRGDGLRPIRGVVPSPARFPPGCRFADRCARAEAVCTARAPSLVRLAPGRSVACEFPLDQDAERAELRAAPREADA